MESKVVDGLCDFYKIADNIHEIYYDIILHQVHMNLGELRNNRRLIFRTMDNGNPLKRLYEYIKGI